MLIYLSFAVSNGNYLNLYIWQVSGTKMAKKRTLYLFRWGTPIFQHRYSNSYKISNIIFSFCFYTTMLKRWQKFTYNLIGVVLSILIHIKCAFLAP